MATRKLKIKLELDARFKRIAKMLPSVQIEITGIKQTIKGQPLYVDHHAEIRCYYLKRGQKGLRDYVDEVMTKQKTHKEKSEVVERFRINKKIEG